MAESKKYYYMRLQEGYFDSDEQILLESMPDGYLYSNILLKLYLKSLKRNGLLMFNERIPYNAQMIATITRHQIGTVEKAMEIFQQLGIVEVLDSGAIYMMDVQNYVGKTSTEADRIRAYRAKVEEEKNKAQPLPESTCTNKQDSLYICTPEKEIEIEIEKEKEKKIIMPVSDEAGEQPTKPKRSKRFTPPEVEEVAAYCEERKNGIDAQHFVDYYEARGWMIGKNRMKDWKAAVRTWERNRDGGGTNGKPEKPAYDAGAFGTIL